jgi:hypothetical protein
MDACVRAIRNSVCIQCAYGSPEACKRRDTMECSLERYIPLVVEKVGEMSGGVYE